MSEIYHGLQYLGCEGDTESCKQAVMELIQYGREIHRVIILTHKRAHGLLLEVEYGDLIVIRAGFTSGYGGQGPHSFSYVLRLLSLHEIDIRECEVEKSIFDRANSSLLTVDDVESIQQMKHVHPRMRWYDYIVYHDEDNPAVLWQEFPQIIPLSIVDPRLSDLVLKFHDNPDECLITGYRRLEDILRERTKLHDLHGSELITKCFLSNPSYLKWESNNPEEGKGRCKLFLGAFMAFSTPRAHRELKTSGAKLVMEFIQLNHLYLLESDAIDKGTHTLAMSYIDDQCVYIGGDPREEADCEGSVSVSSDFITFEGHSGRLIEWKLDEVIAADYKPGYTYSADEKREAYQEAKHIAMNQGSVLAHFRMDDIPSGTIVRIQDPERIIPEGLPIHLGFRSEYCARLFAKRVRDAARLSAPSEKCGVLQLIEQGENEQVEFKEELNWKCIQSIAAFANTDGGVLLIGVTDSGQIQSVLQEDNPQDKYILKVSNSIRDKLNMQARECVKVSFSQEHGVCRIDCSPSSIPVFYRANGNEPEQLFVRRGPSTQRLKGKDIVEFDRQRFS